MIRYALGWLVVGTVGAVAIIALLGGFADETDQVMLPPVRETQLETAAMRAGCRLVRARPRERLNPAVDGPAGSLPAAAGVYDRAPVGEAVAGAVRRGIVVFHYRGDLADGYVEQLRALQRVVPAGTIVTPNESGMPFAFAATAYRRLLGCARFTPKAIDAARLFRGRYLGRKAQSG